MNTETPLQGDETLIDRLKKIHDESEADMTKMGANRSTLVSKDFDQLVRIAKSEARTEPRREGNTDEVDYIDSLVVVTDGSIPDAHKNEINLSGFVHRFIPESEWHRFIEPEED